MTLHSRFLLFALSLLVFIAACDSSEDPNLLNPPLPDSTQVRVVNLVAGEPIDATLGGVPVALQMAPFRSGDFRGFLTTERINFTTTRPSRRDTLVSQSLTAGVRFTYFVLGSASETKILRAATGNQEETDLASRNLARLVFINAIADSDRYQIRRGCASGDTLFDTQSFGSQGLQDIAESSLSLFLFSSRDSLVPAATARISVTPGAVTYLIAARDNGRTRLYTLSSSASDPSGALTEAPPENRTTATVQILNAVTGSTGITVARKGGSPIAADLQPLQISTASTVQACSDTGGDSLVITPSSGAAPSMVPLRLSVGTWTLVIVYGSQNDPKVLALPRDVIAPDPGKIRFRGINISSAPQVSITIGAGAPTGVTQELRPFGTMAAGTISNNIDLPVGAYPLILRNAQTGGFVMAGVETFTSGYYTVMVIDRDTTQEIVFLREDVPDKALDPVDRQGTLATFFSMMPDISATFTVGSLMPDTVAYSYTTSTVLPLGVTSITSNAGQVAVDPTSGGYLIGATGSGSNRQLIAFQSPIAPPPVGKTVIRFLNAVPDASELWVHINGYKTPPDATLPFGQPTTQIPLDARKYSFIVTRPSDTATVARLDGVELIANRSYVLVVGPGRGDQSSGTSYGTLLLQE